MDTLEILKRARNVIADPANWCQGTFAKTPDGDHVLPQDDRATQFCALGACSKVCGVMPSGMDDETFDILRTVVGDLGSNSIVDINDHRGHESTVKMFDMAIEDYDWYAMRAW